MMVHYMAYGLVACMREGPPGSWKDDDRWSAEWKDVTCPQCLAGKDFVETFTLSPDGKSITCKRCKRTSYNPNDVENHYCGCCHVFHDDLWPPARRWWIEHPDEPRIMNGTEPKLCETCRHMRNRTPKDKKVEAGHDADAQWCSKLDCATAPALCRCGGDDWEAKPTPLERYNAEAELTRVLKHFEAQHGEWSSTQWLLHELVRIQKKGTVRTADYAGDDFRVTVKLSKKR